MFTERVAVWEKEQGHSHTAMSTSEQQESSSAVGQGQAETAQSITVKVYRPVASTSTSSLQAVQSACPPLIDVEPNTDVLTEQIYQSSMNRLHMN